MTPADLRSPSRLPQPISPVSPSGDVVDNVFNGTNSKESRRRSLLPQRSTSCGRARPITVYGLDATNIDGAADTGTGTDSDPAARARQRLGSVAEGSKYISDQDEGDDSAVLAQRQAALDALMGDAPSAVTKPVAKPQSVQAEVRHSRVMAKPGAGTGSIPQPAGLGRASSIRRPAAGIPSASRPERASRMGPPSAAASAVSRSQARHTPSTSTGSARPSSRSSATTATSGGRPPSASSARPPSASSARPPSASSTSATGRISRTNSTSARPESGLARTASTRDASSTKGSLKHPSTTLPNLQTKPQFTTYQQHYSPKKNFAPKPLTSSFLPKAATAGPTRSTTALEPPSAEMTRQQTDLLQLSIMHQQALPCLAAFEQSAETKLRRRFEGLSRRCKAVQDVERAERTARNVAALREWGGGGVGGLQENIRVLSGVLRELAALQDDGSSGMGRFDRVVQKFARWVEWVEQVWQARQTNHGDLEIVEELPREWQVELAALQRKVALLLRELDCLDVPDPGSSVAQVLSGTRASLDCMSEELKVMRVLSGAIIGKETSWVNERVNELQLSETIAVS